jgi:dTDP-4-amino-4,6-dideoxygalactose transaminase
MKYRLNVPWISSLAKEYVMDVLNSGWLSAGGVHTEIFQTAFAELHSQKFGYAVSSGTAGLTLAMRAICPDQHTNVIVPNFICGSVPAAVRHAGQRVVLCDVENATYALDADEVERLLLAGKDRVSAVILAHIYGIPARDTIRIKELCDRYGAYLIEDCCESHGCMVQGGMVGSVGDISVYSVRSEKMIGVGEGAVVCTNSEHLLDDVKYWANRGLPDMGAWERYQAHDDGYNFAMPHLLGALGRAQVEEFDQIFSRKRNVGQTYRRLWRRSDLGNFAEEQIGDRAGYWLNAIRLQPDAKDPRVVGSALMKEGIECRPGFPPMSSLPPYLTGGRFPMSEILASRLLVLPSDQFLSENDIHAIVTKVVEVLELR